MPPTLESDGQSTFDSTRALQTAKEKGLSTQLMDSFWWRMADGRCNPKRVRLFGYFGHNLPFRWLRSKNHQASLLSLVPLPSRAQAWQRRTWSLGNGLVAQFGCHQWWWLVAASFWIAATPKLPSALYFRQNMSARCFFLHSQIVRSTVQQ